MIKVLKILGHERRDLEMLERLYVSELKVNMPEVIQKRAVSYQATAVVGWFEKWGETHRLHILEKVIKSFGFHHAVHVIALQKVDSLE